jgi:hypothetical protein
MNIKKVLLIALLALVLLLGCTQNSSQNQNGNLSITDNDFNKANLNEDNKADNNTLSPNTVLESNDMNVPNLEGCEKMNYAWKCNLSIGVDQDADNFFDKMNELGDFLGTFCLSMNGSSSTSSTVDSNLVYFCTLYLDDSSKSCKSSLDCKGGCILTTDSNYDSDFISNEIGSKVECLSCKGECSSGVLVGTIGTQWLEFNNGFIEVVGVQ